VGARMNTPKWVPAFLARIGLTEAACARSEEENEEFIWGVINGYHFFANEYAKDHAWIFDQEALMACARAESQPDASEVALLGFCGGYLSNMQSVIERDKEHV